MSRNKLDLSLIQDPSIKILNILAMGQTLRACRKSAKLSMIEIAKRTGININTIVRIENGVGEPSIQRVAIMCSALGLKLKDIEVWEYPPRKESLDDQQ